MACYAKCFKEKSWGQHHLWQPEHDMLGWRVWGGGHQPLWGPVLGSCSHNACLQAQTPTRHHCPPPTPPQISTVSYSPCHKHSESPVHLPLLIAVEAGLKPFSPCQMCVAAPRVCFYPEPDRRRCLMLQSPKEGAWREEERREFSPLGGVGGVV